MQFQLKACGENNKKKNIKQALTVPEILKQMLESILGVVHKLC